jgi:peptide/nickel transport system permease protein
VGLVLGVPTGLVAGYRGGGVDSFLRLIFDGIMSVPGIIFIVAVVAITGPNLPVAMAVFGVLASPRFFRVQRGETITISGETFVEASRAIGCTSTRTLVRHVFLNTISAIVVQTSIMLGVAVIVEASISFLGLGAQPPTASWGAMLKDVAVYMSKAPHMVVPPGVVIVLVVLSFSYLGDALRDLVGGRSAE